MKVLVAGAGGFLGTAVVRALAERGTEVVGLVRRPAQRSAVVAAGGTPVLGDVLVPASLGRASAGCGAIVHLASSPVGEPSGTRGAERVRIEGAHNLVRAARAEGVRRLVVGSGYWVYRGGPGVLTESSPLDPRGESRINFEAERAGLAGGASGVLEVLVVRPGMVYGDGSWFRPIRDAVLGGTYRVIEDGANRWSFVALPDAGAAFARLVADGAPGEVYNVSDGRPAPWREFARFVADRLQRPAPGRISLGDAAHEYGAEVAHHLAADRAISPAKLESLGWRPRYASFREGVAALLEEMAPLGPEVPPHRSTDDREGAAERTGAGGPDRFT